jgi:cellulose synthase/poly-beta-1,6-N-acetylglucosamine synthase-like glycosyltransferase
MFALIAFWLSAGIVIYVYAGYPLVLLSLRGLMGRPAPRPPSMPAELAAAPSASLVVAAYNEAEFIGAKLQNSLALDYPADRLEIVVASDGSRDATVEIVRQFTDDPRVRLCDYPENRGKLYVINDSIPQLTGEIVAFSDASSMLATDAMRRLLAHFGDPHVGAVSGVYKVTEQDQARHGIEEDFYWRYETFLKLQESAIGSILGCHGSLYAIRKDLYPFPDPRTINDDYVIPMRILQQGYRIAYEPAAVAAEEAKQMGGFSRRVRIMAGNFRQLRELTALLRPFRPLELFFFFSHKAGRLIVPWALIVMLWANLRLLDRPFFQWTLAAQLGFYAVAVAGAIWPLWPEVLRLPYFFCMINVASFLGLFSAISGRNEVPWRRESPPLVSAASDPRSAP